MHVGMSSTGNLKEKYGSTLKDILKDLDKVDLSNCIADASSLCDLAYELGYSPYTLLTDAKATRSKVLDAIKYAISNLDEGDIFFASFSGFSGPLGVGPMIQGTTAQHGFALQDDIIYEMELYDLWAQFKPGVRIVFVQDSMFLPSHPSKANKLLGLTSMAPRAISAPELYDTDVDLPNAIAHKALRHGDILASVLLIASSQNSESAVPGVFVKQLLDIVDNGKFDRSFKDFLYKLKQKYAATIPAPLLMSSWY